MATELLVLYFAMTFLCGAVIGAWFNESLDRGNPDFVPLATVALVLSTVVVCITIGLCRGWGG